MREYRRFSNSIQTVPLADLLLLANDFFSSFDNDGPFECWSNQPPIGNSDETMRVGVYPWALETLLREAFSQCRQFGTSNVRDWNKFAKIMNSLKAVADNSYSGVPNEWVYHELFRVAHQQFHWQRRVNGRYVSRYIEMYKHPELVELIESNLGAPAPAVLTFGLGLYSHFRNFNPVLNWPMSTAELGLSQDQAFSILNRISANIQEFSTHSTANRGIDVNFPYKESLLRRYPLIKLQGNGIITFACPIPRFLLYRLFDGLFFDLVRQSNFANAYGTAFEQYATNLAKRVLPARVDVRPQEKYGKKAERKDSVDLILVDDTATAFVECKTRRVAAQAKADLRSTGPIDEEMSKLALNVAKTYKSIRDALEGKYTHWTPVSRPTYLIVLMLTDWYVFSKDLRDQFFLKLGVALDSLKVDRSIITEAPLVECSADDFEVLCAVLNDASIDSVLGRKTDDEHESWELLSYLNKYYRGHVEMYVSKVANMSETIKEMIPQRA
jgi:hypothetical protein